MAEITFELHAPTLEESEDVFITGNIPVLGNWDPAAKKMKSIGGHRWQFVIQAQKGRPIEYKYTLGSWQQEGANADGRRLMNFAIDVDASKTVSDQIEKWTSAENSGIEGGVTGNLKYHRAVPFEGLLPRDLVVWLPPDYQTSDLNYGVVYMHDGQNLFDPKTSSFGTDWQIDETLTEYFRKNDNSQKYICVGIYNTSQRSQDYLPGEQGDRYIEFVCRKVKPLIDREYRTKPQREFTLIGGSSNGGICAFRCAWENPDIFSKAICFSPAFLFRRSDGTKRLDYVSTFVECKRPESTPETPFFYLANGGIGLEKILQPGIDQMIEAMKAKGMKEGKHFRFKLYEKDQHHESAWARQFAEAIPILLK